MRVASELFPGAPEVSVAELRWDDHALDLRMHVHEHSDRFIIVHEGRGYFHVIGCQCALVARAATRPLHRDAGRATQVG